MRKQHHWIRQQLICCFIHTYTQMHHLPPTVREIGAWVGCPGMRSLQRALTDLEQQQYLTRRYHAQRSIVLTAKGIALAERWQLLVPIAGTDASTLQRLGAASKLGASSFLAGNDLLRPISSGKSARLPQQQSSRKLKPNPAAGDGIARPLMAARVPKPRTSTGSTSAAHAS